MRVLLSLTLVVLACSFQLTRCDDGEQPGEAVDEPRVSEELVDKKDGIRSGTRRTTTQPSVNTTRDSQLLSVLAARRRQLLNGRLATHINTLAALAHKNKGNTTFAQLEVRDSNSSIVKRITFDNGSNEAAPSLKIVTTDGTREIKQDVKPHEIRHLFIPKVYQETRSRGGFLNNRRKEFNITKVSNASQEVVTEHVAVYIPPEKLEGLDKEIELDPEEEFQVDESNHGLYLLNYSDTDNVTLSSEFNKTLNANETKENSVAKPDDSMIKMYTPKETKIPDLKEKTTESNNNTINSTEESNKLIKVESEKDKDNNTLFMSDEIYNHFRPLESELPVEDMAPFLYFGQKIAGQIISDNLTYSPSLSASTKSVNFIIAPHERRKFNSRYSVTEKYKNSSVDEEEINEDMDVSVVKNIIEKNKVRNTVKGTAPGRHVGLVNAYRKYTTSSTSKPPNIAQLNVTDPMVSVTPSTLDKSKDSNKTNTVVLKESLIKMNSTKTNNDSIVENGNINKNIQNRTTSASPRNHTRTYHNLRRRPARVTTSASTDNIPIVTVANATTEKAATLVYTAVVTSVSITSSVKGQNKTDTNVTDTVVNDNSDVKGELILNDKENITIPKAILLEDTETTGSTISSTSKPYKHRIRIRTTTTENPSTPLPRSTDLPVASELSAKDIEQKNEATQLRISERLASLYGKPEVDTTPSNTTVKPKNILRRRRPTTTSTTPSSTALPTTFSTERPIPISRRPLTTLSSLPTIVSTVSTMLPTTTEVPETTENTFKPFIVTSRTSSESSSKPFNPQGINVNRESNTTKFNTTWNNREERPVDEEVVIEAEKAYTTSYVLAGLGFLPVAAIVAFVLRSVFNKRTKEIDTEYEGYFENGDTKKESPIIPVARPPIPPPSKPDQKWEFPRNKLRLQTLLGQGNFGQVWKAQADDLTGHDGLTRLVAVKSIKETASQKEKQELLHEIFIMQKIGTHPNVVTLLACCTEQEPYLLIMEYVMCGKLLTYLRERRSRPDRFSGSGALTSRDLTVFAYCVARGMDYIASKGIVHRDLAARNVLVDHNKLCKIADFGMSREVAGGEERAKQRHALPVRWMAPEALLYNAYNHETDVWAYGILLWEIVTLGSTPYAAMTGREVLAAVTEGYRLERPPHCKPQLYRAMHSCWHADPTQRPSFAALKSQLADLLDNEPAEGNYVDLESFYQESSVYSDPSAIIHDEEGLSAEYDRERRVFRELAPGPKKYDNRAFNFRDEELRNKFGIGTPRMGGFGIRDVPFSGDFTDRQFARDEKTFNERNFGDSNFNSNFNEPNFNERKDGKLSTSSFHRERERENPLVSRNSFSGFPRLSSQNGHFQLMPDGRNKRVSEFECDI